MSDKTNSEQVSRHVTDRQAAQMTGISRSHWRRLLAAGKVPPFRRLGRSVLWYKDEIAAWIAAGCPDAKEWAAMQAKVKRRSAG